MSLAGQSYHWYLPYRLLLFVWHDNRVRYRVGQVSLAKVVLVGGVLDRLGVLGVTVDRGIKGYVDCLSTVVLDEVVDTVPGNRHLVVSSVPGGLVSRRWNDRPVSRRQLKC